jgi:hypothetical protein
MKEGIITEQPNSGQSPQAAWGRWAPAVYAAVVALIAFNIGVRQTLM